MDNETILNNDCTTKTTEKKPHKTFNACSKKKTGRLCDQNVNINCGMKICERKHSLFSNSQPVKDNNVSLHPEIISVVQIQKQNVQQESQRAQSEKLSRGQIDVVEMETENTQKYKYLFIYEDLFSGFVVLKALHINTAEEVANELLDILTIIGAPTVLQSGNGREFVKQVVNNLHLLWHGFNIFHGNIIRNPLTERNFKMKLKSWLAQNPSKTWVDGIKNVQITENTTALQSNGKIPYEHIFGEKWQFIIKNFSSEYKNVHNEYSEEEWLNKISEYKNINAISLNGTVPIESKKNLELNSEQNLSSNNEETVEYSSDNDNIAENYISVFVKHESVEDPLKMEEPILNNTINVTDELRQNYNKSDLTCKICLKKYMKVGHLKNHMKTHLIKNHYDCEFCSKTFRVKSLYEKHITRSHSQSKLIDATDTVTSLPKRQPEKQSNKNNVEQRLKPDRKLNIKSLKSRLTQRTVSTKTRTNYSLECTYCKQKFDFPSVLKRHIRSHTNERPYVCQVCSKSFKQLGHLSQHALTHTNYRSLQCSFCNVKFESLETLKEHSQSHRDEERPREAYRLFECDNCKKVFTTKSVLERHIFTHTHERQFGCKVCGKRFKQAGHVKSHMLVHTGERKFQCTVCSKRFSLSNTLKKHMYVHNGEKPYQCDVCRARFLERRNLNGHLMTHTNERPYSCKICGKRYTLADTLKRHVSAAHEHGRTYQCEICAKMFKQLAHLSVHKKVHNDERPFQCHLCEKNFKHKNVLKSHLAIHANVRPFECDICKATFVRKTNLQTHITSAHMNERPYICTICNKRFKQISHLNGHVVVHSNSMPYQCDFCDRRCNRLDNLKKHMRLHAKDKSAFQG